jgi:hypothetical protein
VTSPRLPESWAAVLAVAVVVAALHHAALAVLISVDHVRNHRSAHLRFAPPR